MPAHFTLATFRFLQDLADNNDRAWFQAEKERYERDVLDPALGFISDFGPGLRQISRSFDAIPKRVGGSLFRIHRDVRFSEDKRPYKTQVGIHFRHRRARDAHAPGFYLHLEPGGSFFGAGLWRPDSGTLATLRSAMIDDPEAWHRSRDCVPEDYALGGESLKTAPRGISIDHPLIEDLRRKDLVVMRPLSEKQVTADDFLEQYREHCQAAAPLVEWICRAIDVPF
jgi:uncharacterized protein (TIGR02453 family)